jgi:hypothetical protein
MSSKLYRADQAGAGRVPCPWPSFIGVDEGLDRLFRWSAESQRVEWSQPLKSKCRSLQKISDQRVLAVHDRGFAEIDAATGAGVEDRRLETGGVISATRVSDGGTVLAGLNLAGLAGICFVDHDGAGRVRRTMNVPGDYVRCCSITPQNTLLYTANTVVHETDWRGKHIQSFQADGFYHAWKPVRLSDGGTRISAGYGAFLVEFDERGEERRRWTVPDLYKAEVRPFFFGDFSVRANGNIVVCNWLGHGPDKGNTGYSLLEFTPAGEFVGGWQDARGISSLQTFLLC